MFSRQKAAMGVAELMGVIVLATAMYAMVGRTTFPLFAGLAAGITTGLLVHTIGATSGAHINPAITLSLWTVRKVKTVQAVLYIIVQMLGGLAAWGIIRYFMGHSIESIAGSKFDWKILIAEGIGAFVFAFGVASAIYQKYEGAKLSFTIGASLTIGILVASLGSNALVNPAVALGIQSWSWAYAVGPLVGAIVGMNVYALLFAEETLFKRAAVASRSTRAAVVAKKPVKRVAAKKPVRKAAARKRR
jgi:glycerol uptake facilitator-like aquaporin